MSESLTEGNISTAEEHRQRVAAEYGQYVATKPITIGGARAFNVGDPVPAGHVSGGLVPESSVSSTDPDAG